MNNELNITRVVWREVRATLNGKTLFFMIADQNTSGNWTVCERESGDLRWHSALLTADREARIEKMAARNNSDSLGICNPSVPDFLTQETYRALA